MSEFFLELFSEEIPADLQSNARKELQEILGKPYAPAVNRILKANGVNPEKEKPFSNQMINMVLHGRRENIDIELAIYQLRDQIIRKNAALQKARAASHS